MQKANEFLRVEVADSVASIVIDRPERRNAFNWSMWDSLTDICNSLSSDTAIKAVVLRSSSSTAFCAGADISEFAELIQDTNKVEANAQSIRAASQALQTLPRPTIACIQGSCFGGGALLALACDFRVADAGATFAITPAKLGLCYSIRDTSNLVNTVGLPMARRMLLLAEVLDAETALRCGLVDRLVNADVNADINSDTGASAEAINSEVRTMVSTLSRHSQFSLRNLKRGLHSVSLGQMQDDAESIARFVEAFHGEDLAEGMDAFLSRRQPRFPFS